MGLLDDIKRQLEKQLREEGIEITVIDDSDSYGFVASMTHVDEIYMEDVKSMVANVLKAKGPYKIRRLNIVDHGNEHLFQVGRDRIAESNFSTYEPELAKLKGHFHAGGFVHLPRKASVTARLVPANRSRAPAVGRCGAASRTGNGTDRARSHPHPRGRRLRRGAARGGRLEQVADGRGRPGA